MLLSSYNCRNLFEDEGWEFNARLPTKHSMKLRNLLVELGFRQDRTIITDEQPGYLYDFGNLELSASQVTNKYFKPVFLFAGIAQTTRTLAEICFEMPLDIDSYKQGVAWIAYGVGKDFRPKKSTDWLEQGREWSDTLPWEMEKREYDRRPRCSVDRDWFRVATKKLSFSAFIDPSSLQMWIIADVDRIKSNIDR
jgi:hypothetical protein